jgi:hypothetical protein
MSQVNPIDNLKPSILASDCSKLCWTESIWEADTKFCQKQSDQAQIFLP